MDYLIQHYGIEVDSNDARIVFIPLSEATKSKLKLASQLINESGMSDKARKLEYIVSNLDACDEWLQTLNSEISTILYQSNGYERNLNGGQWVEYDLPEIETEPASFIVSQGCDDFLKD